MSSARLLFLGLLLVAFLTTGCLPGRPQHLAELEIKEAPGGLIIRPPRPGGAKDIRYIMLHAISDGAVNPRDPFQLQRIRALFQDYQVEAHYLIDRQGQIFRFVPDTRTARHAGTGSWAQDPAAAANVNRYAIGIELMGIGSAAEMEEVIGPKANALIKAEHRGYTEEQYLALNLLLAHLLDRYSIPPGNVLTHAQYAPGRKWDPGELFDWDQLEL